MYLKYGDDFRIFIPDSIKEEKDINSYIANLKSVANNMYSTRYSYGVDYDFDSVLKKDCFSIEDLKGLTKPGEEFLIKHLYGQCAVGNISNLGNEIFKFYFSYLGIYI